MTHKEYLAQKPIHDNSVHSVLKHLADKEAQFAHERYGFYHSPHEGLGIVEEEAQEARWAEKSLRRSVHDLQYAVWNNMEPQHSSRDAYEAALQLAQEAIHTAATAKRFIEAAENGADEWYTDTDAGGTEETE